MSPFFGVGALTLSGDSIALAVFEVQWCSGTRFQGTKDVAIFAVKVAFALTHTYREGVAVRAVTVARAYLSFAGSVHARTRLVARGTVPSLPANALRSAGCAEAALQLALLPLVATLAPVAPCAIPKACGSGLKTRTQTRLATRAVLATDVRGAPGTDELARAPNIACIARA